MTAGFLFQVERALYWLAESGNQNAVIGVETLADVFVSNPVEPDIHEEDKHSIQHQGHPLGDRDKRLWRTLENLVRRHLQRCATRARCPMKWGVPRMEFERRTTVGTIGVAVARGYER